MAYMTIQGTPEPAAARRSEHLVAALAPPSMSARLVRCAGRFLANGSQPARHAAPMPGARKARTRRSHVVAAARISQRCMRMASPRKVGRIAAGFRRPSNGKHEAPRIVNPMIPDLAVAARRLSASQRTHPHIYCSDRTPSPDNPCAARREGPSRADGENGASLSATDATIPAAWRRGSTHPDHRMRGSNRVLLRATIDSRTGGAYYDAARGPTECHASVHRVKPELASATRGSRRLRTFVPVGRARIARQTWGAHRWRIGMRVLRSTILNAAYVRLS